MSVAGTGGKSNVMLFLCNPESAQSPFYVYKLQSKIIILRREQPHDFLEVVDLIARDPDMIVQNSWLDLDFKRLDQFNDFQTGLSGDTILYLDVHLCYAKGGGCDSLEIQTPGVNVKPKTLTSKYLYNRFNLHTIPGDNMNTLTFSVKSDFRLHVFEIVSRGNFTFHIVDCIV
jgi:hypothetical protein